MIGETEVKNKPVVELLEMIAESGETDIINEAIVWAFESNKELSALPEFIRSLVEKAKEAELKVALDTLNKRTDINWISALPDKDIASVLETLIGYHYDQTLDDDTLDTIAKVLIMSPQKAVDVLSEGSDDTAEVAKMIKLMFNYVK